MNNRPLTKLRLSTVLSLLRRICPQFEPDQYPHDKTVFISNDQRIWQPHFPTTQHAAAAVAGRVRRLLLILGQLNGPEDQ
jgi:hypothetical protein